MVSKWINEVQAERAAAELLLSDTPDHGLSEAEMRATLGAIGDIREKLGRANGKQRAALYKALGLTAKFNPQEQLILWESKTPSGC